MLQCGAALDTYTEDDLTPLMVRITVFMAVFSCCLLLAPSIPRGFAGIGFSQSLDSALPPFHSE